eukprot:642858-Prymnesium_polylepis.2
MDTEFNARDHGGFTLVASVALIAAAALNTVEHVFQARHAIRKGHGVLATVHAFIFLSGVSYAVVMVTQACFFVEALLDALSLLYISQLDQLAFSLAKELGVVHLLARPWQEAFAFWRQKDELRAGATSQPVELL